MSLVMILSLGLGLNFFATAATPLQDCQLALATLTEAMVGLRTFDRDEELSEIESRLDAVVRFLVDHGVDQSYANRVLTRLGYQAVKFDLEVIDRDGPFFEDVARKHRLDEYDRSRAVFGHFFASWGPDRRRKFEIVLDAGAPAFAEVVMEEALHARLEEFVIDRAMKSRTSPLPYVLTAPAKKIFAFLNEYVTQDTVEVWAMRRPRDVAMRFALALSRANRDESSIEALTAFIKLFSACAGRAGVSWADLSTYRLMRCAMTPSTAGEFANLLAEAERDSLKDLFGAALRTNQSFAP